MRGRRVVLYGFGNTTTDTRTGLGYSLLGRKVNRLAPRSRVTILCTIRKPLFAWAQDRTLAGANLGSMPSRRRITASQAIQTNDSLQTSAVKSGRNAHVRHVRVYLVFFFLPTTACTTLTFSNETLAIFLPSEPLHPRRPSRFGSYYSLY